MEIEEKYLKLLNILIYDKRTRMNGIISELFIMQLISGYTIGFKAYMSKTQSNQIVFVDDFENGSIVFLLPFGINYKDYLMGKMAKEHEAAIREFFGENFREDMIMRISEDDRQEKIRQRENLTLGLENWDKIIETDGWMDADRELPEKNKNVLCVVEYMLDGKDFKKMELLKYGGSGRWKGLGREKDRVTWWRYTPDFPKRSQTYDKDKNS